MDKHQLINNLNKIDDTIEICRSTLSLLSETLDEEAGWVLNGLILHLADTGKLIDHIEESIYSKGVPA